MNSSNLLKALYIFLTAINFSSFFCCCFVWRNMLQEKLNSRFIFSFSFLILDKIKNGANITLLILSVLSVYSHYMVNDPIERSGPSLVFLFMLGGRLVVWFQVNIIYCLCLRIDIFKYFTFWDFFFFQIYSSYNIFFWLFKLEKKVHWQS